MLASFLGVWCLYFCFWSLIFCQALDDRLWLPPPLWPRVILLESTLDSEQCAMLHFRIACPFMFVRLIVVCLCMCVYACWLLWYLWLSCGLLLSVVCLSVVYRVHGYSVLTVNEYSLCYVACGNSSCAALWTYKLDLLRLYFTKPRGVFTHAWCNVEIITHLQFLCVIDIVMDFLI